MNRDAGDLLALLDFEKPEAIVNFAAQSEVALSWDYPEHWFQTNTVALARLVNHLRSQKYLKPLRAHFLPEAYGTCVGRVTEESPLNPSTPYAASKAAADFLLKTYAVQFGFPLITVRATNVYGARQQLSRSSRVRRSSSSSAARSNCTAAGGRSSRLHPHSRRVAARGSCSNEGESGISTTSRPMKAWRCGPSCG